MMNILPFSGDRFGEYEEYRGLIDRSLEHTVLPACGRVLTDMISRLYTPNRLNHIPLLLGAYDAKKVLQAMGGIKPFEDSLELCALYAEPTKKGAVGALQVMAVLGDIATHSTSKRVITHALPSTKNVIETIGAISEGEVHIQDGDYTITAERMSFDRTQFENSCLYRLLQRIEVPEGLALRKLEHAA